MSDLARIEAELTKLTRQLGDFLSLPPCDRTTPAFAKIWRPISRYRVELRTALREMGSQFSDPRVRSGVGSEIEQRMGYAASNTRLRLWPRIEDLINKQITPLRRDLMAQPADFMAGAHNRYVNHLYAALHTLALPSSEAMKHRIAGSHEDIALPATHFEALLHAAYRVCLAQGRDTPPCFLDVGCGGGTKIFAALHFFRDARGLENNPVQVQVAQAIMAKLNVPSESVIEADALTFDDYGAYDVIYFFRPLKSASDLKAMEDRILAAARPGTLLIAPYPGFSAERDDPRCTLVSPSIYVAHTAPYQVEGLRNRAEMIGTDAPAHDSAADASLGYWRPVVEASRRNGYAL